MICGSAGGKSVMSQPPKLGSPEVSTSVTMQLMMKMKAVIGSVLWSLEEHSCLGLQKLGKCS